MINLLFPRQKHYQRTTTGDEQKAKVEDCVYGWAADDDKRLKMPDALNNQLTSIT